MAQNEEYKGVKYEKIVTGYITNPKWKAFNSKNDIVVVEVDGISKNNEKICIQFSCSDFGMGFSFRDTCKFKPTYISVDEQSVEIEGALDIMLMYAKNKSGSLINFVEYEDDKNKETEKVTTEKTTTEKTTTEKATTEKTTTEELTTEEIEEVPESSDTAYKLIYKTYLDNLDDSYKTDDEYGYMFDLIYIDGDNIPELVIYGACEADGTTICTCNNEDIDSVIIGNSNHFFYNKSGKIYASDGKQGVFKDGIYKVEDGKINRIFYGTYEDPYYGGTRPYRIYEMPFSGNYYEVDSDEYNKTYLSYLGDFNEYVEANKYHYHLKYSEIYSMLQDNDEGELSDTNNSHEGNHSNRNPDVIYIDDYFDYSWTLEEIVSALAQAGLAKQSGAGKCTSYENSMYMEVNIINIGLGGQKIYGIYDVYPGQDIYEAMSSLQQLGAVLKSDNEGQMLWESESCNIIIDYEMSDDYSTYYISNIMVNFLK